MSTLADDYPLEQGRCRELLAGYQSISTGALGAKQIEQILREADEAVASGDVVAMIRSFKIMQGCE